MRKRSVQARAVETRHRIVEGALSVLAEQGVSGLTHRAIARAAGVSLAATTYHFATKADILDEASKALLDGYLHAFSRLEARILRGEQANIRSLADLEGRVLQTALGRERRRSLAWCELILHEGRQADDPAIARDWYARLVAIWGSIAAHLGEAEPEPERAARAAIDRVVGLTFLLHAVSPGPDQVTALLAGEIDLGALVPAVGAETAPPASPARARVLSAAIEQLIEEGAAGVSLRAVAARAGMVRSGPSYHFPSIDLLLIAAEAELFERAKRRYRDGLASIAPSEMNETALIDLTTAIFFREVLEFPQENMGLYSVFLRGAQYPALAVSIGAFLTDFHSAWQRRLAAVLGDDCPAQAGLGLFALFVGKLIRLVATGAGMAELSRTRESFAREVARARSLTG